MDYKLDCWKSYLHQLAVEISEKNKQSEDICSSPLNLNKLVVLALLFICCTSYQPLTLLVQAY